MIRVVVIALMLVGCGSSDNNGGDSIAGIWQWPGETDPNCTEKLDHFWYFEEDGAYFDVRREQSDCELACVGQGQYSVDGDKVTIEKPTNRQTWTYHIEDGKLTLTLKGTAKSTPRLEKASSPPDPRSHCE